MKQRLIDANEFAIEEPKLWDWDSIDGISSTAVLKQCIWDVQCAPVVEAIPIDWIKKYIEDNTQIMINPEYENTEFTEEPIDYYIKLYPYQINTMLKEWEKEK